MRLAFAAFNRKRQLKSAVDALFHHGWDRDDLTLLISLAAQRSGASWIELFGEPRVFEGRTDGAHWRFSGSRMLRELESRDAATTGANERLLRNIMPAASAAYFEPIADGGAWLLFAQTDDGAREKVACKILLAHAASNVHLCDFGGDGFS